MKSSSESANTYKSLRLIESCPKRRVVNIGRYRMLKDMESGKILKTKSEVSALQEFIDWLRESAEREGAPKSEGVLLACHEPTRKVLVPLLLEALDKYNLGRNLIELDKVLAS